MIISCSHSLLLLPSRVTYMNTTLFISNLLFNQPDPPAEMCTQPVCVYVCVCVCVCVCPYFSVSFFMCVMSIWKSPLQQMFTSLSLKWTVAGGGAVCVCVCVCVCVYLCVHVCGCVLSLLLMSNSVCLQNADKSQVEDTGLLHTHTHTHTLFRVLTVSYLAPTLSCLIWRHEATLQTHSADVFTTTALSVGERRCRPRSVWSYFGSESRCSVRCCRL